MTRSAIAPTPRWRVICPSREVLDQEAIKAAAAALAKRYEVAGVRALLTQAPYVKSVVRDAVKYARQTETAGLRFVLAFAQMCADDPWTNREVAEAAVRVGDDALFARAFAVEHQATSFALFEQSGTLTKDKNFLRKPPADAACFTLSLRAGDGDAVDHAVEVETWPGAATRVACTFPRALAADDAVRYFAEMADILQFQSGMAGHTVAERDNCNVYEGVHWDSAPLYARCLGFAPRYSGHALANDAAAVAHWLTFLAHPLVATLGGEAALAQAIGSARLQRLAAGVCIRASAAAPIGLLANPRDVGALPDVARALRTLRPSGDAECTGQQARWDAVPAAPWTNHI